MKPSILFSVAQPYLKGMVQPESILSGKDIYISSLQSLALQIAEARERDPEQGIALILPDLFQLQQFSDLYSDTVSESDAMLFPRDEIVRLTGSASSSEMGRERLRTLSLLVSGNKGLVLLNAPALLTRLVPPETFAKNSLHLEVNQTLERESLIEHLSAAGYMRVDWIDTPSQFAARGCVVDVFSPGNSHPVRIEFDDDRIESISLFSPETKLDTESLSETVILPCSERPIGKEAAQRGCSSIDRAIAQMSKDGNTGNGFLTLKARLRTSEDEILSSGNIGESNERLVPYFHIETASILDYLEGYRIYAVDPDACRESAEKAVTEERTFLGKLREDRSALPGESGNEAKNIGLIDESHSVFIDAFKSDDGIGKVSATNRNLSESVQLFDSLKREGYRVYACVGEKIVPSLTEYLSKAEEPFSVYPRESESGITVIPEALSTGFTIGDRAAFVSSREIYGAALRRSRFLTRYRDFKAVRKYSDLKDGDYVVHEDNGIGIYRGLEQIKGIDYLKIEYARGTTLYVPVFQFGKIRKYAGSEASRPSLDVIGGSTWARRKSRIKSRLTFLTDRLLNIYAERASVPGISFPEDAVLEEAFASAFQFPLTEGQVEAWQSISRDMERPHPMDRLIAGDVGFGKTELAFKASFRAIENGYQAAILCPTTVLARQHYEVALDRFQGFGVRIGILSRYGGNAVNAKTLKDLADGNIDLIIGTHRLLSTDVRFKKLGFLAVDEEQRFGVAQKERIKEITSSVDVLSLSATPIPRTLQMSLMSIKPMSVLQEAPSNRLPVKTYVVQEDEGLVKEVIARELARGGQVYLLHNRIDSIYTRAGEIKKMFPNARIGVAHGRLDPESMSDIMNDFYDGKIDILVCTSIIESGLDVPNVNTVIIEEAQNFGLSALYQIKGRVGRSDRIAYAYLLYRNYSKLSDEGKERLKAIKEFTALGSGYKIAQRDLAIRGAGNILGTEQAGFVDSIGVDAYNQLLEEVIRQRTAQEKGMEIEERPKQRFSLSFTIEARIPEDYAGESDRINLYRELADCLTIQDLDSFVTEIRESFGPYPAEVENLIMKKRIELTLQDERIFDRFEELMESFRITLSESYSDIRDIAKVTESILSPLDNHIQAVRFTARRFIIILRRTADYLSDLAYLTKAISDAYNGKLTPEE